jgi:diguanylate cyclase (GGDEF)-like protein/PAS domain S-box-containing protein
MSSRFRLLVIEDEDQDFKLLLRHLDGSGIDYSVDRAANAAELTALLSRAQRDWNLILADYSLPDIDIRTKLHWIMSKLPDAPVIMVSGSIGEERAVDLMLSGVDDFVSKDNLARLTPAMQRTIDALESRLAKRSAEDALELRNRALEAASNGVVITLAGGDMPMVYVNPAFSQVTGYTAEEVIGRNCRLLHGADSAQAGLDEIRKAVSRREPCTVVIRNYRRDGEMFWNRLSIAPVSDRQGNTTHFVGIQEDISDSIEQQQSLRESAAVFENALEGMTVTKIDGSVVEVNRAFTEITGYSRDEVIGKNLRLLKSGRHGHDFYQTMWSSLRQAGRWSGEVWNRRKSGELYPQLLNISMVRDSAGDPCKYVGVFADISQIKRSEEKLDFLAHHDALTELPNRLLFNARLAHALEHSKRFNQPLAVMFLDIDRFKMVNDAHGHPVGDALLRATAERLAECVRAEDTVARIGGDEFVVLLERIGAEDAGLVANKILQAFYRPLNFDGREQYASMSIGISLFPRDASDAASLVRNADSALYQAKESGRSTYRFYSPELTERASERADLANDLHRAIELEQLTLVYQPQVDLASGKMVGVEALLRWQHPDRGHVSPARFIPIAEETGLIKDVGEWVLQTACAQARRWLDDGIEFGRIAVNIAGPQIRSGDLHLIVSEVLGVSGLPAHRLELEVTESFIMQDPEQSIDDMRRLRELGLDLSIDDFGTGYSSLSYLKRLPINRLKIDQSFVRDLPADEEDSAIAAAVIALGNSLGLDIVAEGIETEEQRSFLVDAGCPHGQGYLFSRPLHAEALVGWLTDRQAGVERQATRG